MFDHGRAAFLGSPGISMHRSRGIDITLAVAPEPAEDTADIHDGTFVLDVLRRHQVAVFDTDSLENPVGRLQPFPSRRCGGDRDAARHTETDILAGLGLNLGQEIDGIGLKSSHIRVGVKRVHPAGRMPGRTGRQHGALQQADIRPAKLGQVVEHGTADHTTADYDNLILIFHIGSRSLVLLNLIFHPSCPTRREKSRVAVSRIRSDLRSSGLQD